MRAEQAPELRYARSAPIVEQGDVEPGGVEPGGVEPGGSLPPPDTPPPNKAALLRPTSRAALQRELLVRHPELVAMAHRARAVTASAHAEGSLPDPVLTAQLWQIPLDRPYAVPDANMLMFGLEQQFPAPGALGMRRDARGHEALAEIALLRARAGELLRDLGIAYADYLEAWSRHHAHMEHRAILERIAHLAVARSAAGSPATDATQAALELARLEADEAFDNGRLDAARARINALLVRPPGSPLGPPLAAVETPSPPPMGELVGRARSRRPELTAAEERRAAAERMLAASEREGAVPSFGAMLSYFAPVGAMAQHSYGVSFSASLPWLWGPKGDQADAYAAQLQAASADVRVAEAQIDGQVAVAVAMARAAQRRLASLRDVARPAARRATELAEAGYVGGGVDLLRVLAAAEGAVSVDLDIAQAKAALERAEVDLEYAMATPEGSNLQVRTAR